MSRYAHGQVGTIQEPYGAGLERALPYRRCVADLRGLYIHETRRRSDGHVDGVTVASRRADAIDANLKFRKGQKQTPSQTAKSRHFLAFSTTTANRYDAPRPAPNTPANSKAADMLWTSNDVCVSKKRSKCNVMPKTM